MLIEVNASSLSFFSSFSPHLFNFVRLKDDVEISKTSKRHNIHSREEGVHLLEISKITVEDKGDYTCLITDGIREVKTSTQLIMKGMSYHIIKSGAH